MNQAATSGYECNGVCGGGGVGNKFVGGAELARRKARNHKRKRHVNNGDTNMSCHKKHYNNKKKVSVLSKSIYKESERFYASLLQHDIDTIIKSNGCESTWMDIMESICGNLNIPLPQPLFPSSSFGYSHKRDYYNALASLVIEESRCILAQGLIMKQKEGFTHGQNGYHLNLIEVKPKSNTGCIFLTFAKVGNHRLDSFKWSRKIMEGNDNIQKMNNNHDDHYRSNYEPFTSDELYNMKPGCIFEIHLKNQENKHGRLHTNQVSFLATVVPKPNRGMDDNNHGTTTALHLVMFSNSEHLREILLSNFGAHNNNIITPSSSLDPSSSCWSKQCYLHPITTLISQQRQFEACMKAPKVCFMNELIGMKTGTHIRFDDDDNDEDDEENGDDNNSNDYNDEDDEEDNSNQLMINNQESCSTTTGTESTITECNRGTGTTINYMKTSQSGNTLCVPKLNQTQEKAAQNFLESPSSHITLIQGPPGTGKTTFMTSVLCKSLFEFHDDGNDPCNDNYGNNFFVNSSKRILVVAPTNKAISVSASRFLKALNGFSHLNVVMIGVEDKLVTDESGGSGIDTIRTNELKSIFVYTWMEDITNRYIILSQKMQRVFNLHNIEDVVKEARLLKDKLKQSIPFKAKELGLLQFAECILIEFESFPHIEKSVDSSFNDCYDLSQAHKLTVELIEILSYSINDSNIIEELLATANVIFCTLSSSGVAMMKRSKHVDG